MPHICPICTKPWRSGQASIKCTTCQKWIHHSNRLNCSKLTETEFQLQSNDSDRIWQCDCCVSNIKFNTFFNLPLYHPTKESYETKKPKTSIFKTAKNNHGEFIAKCSEIGYSLNDVNDNNNAPVITQLNSDYIDVNEFKNKEFSSPNNFSVCHLLETAILMISRLKHRFDIIGITEHKIIKKKGLTNEIKLPSNNIKLPGYQEFLFTPTVSTHGGSGFYTKNDTDYIPRKYLEINEDLNHESTFIEIKFENKKDLIIGCFKFPEGNLRRSKF